MKSIAKLKDRARKHEQKEDWKAAIQAYREVLESQEADDAVELELGLYNRVGDLYLRLGHTGEAVDYYERAADRYADSGFFNNAIALCNKALRHRPDRVELYLKLSRLCREQGFLTDARRWIVDYAERKVKRGETREAIAALLDFVDGSGSPDIRELVARHLATHDRQAEAIDQLRLAHVEWARRGDDEGMARVAKHAKALDPHIQLDDGSRAAPARTPDFEAPGTEGLGLEQATYPAGEADEGDPIAAAGLEGLESHRADPGDVEGDALGGLESFDPTGAAGEAEAAAEDDDPEESEPLPLLDPEPEPAADGERPWAAGQVGAEPELMEPDSADSADSEPIEPLPLLDDAPESGDEATGSWPAEPDTAERESAEDQDDWLAEAMAEPAEAPGVAEPDVAEPDVAEPDVAEPDVAEADVAEPEMAEPRAEPPAEGPADMSEPAEPEPELAGPAEVVPEDLSLPSAEPGEAHVEEEAVEEEDWSEARRSLGFEPIDLDLSSLSFGIAGETEPEPGAGSAEDLDVDAVLDRAKQLVSRGLMGEAARELRLLSGTEASPEVFRHALLVTNEILRHEPNDIPVLQRRVEFAGRIGDRFVMVDTYIDLAEALARSGDDAKARAMYQRILDLDPENVVAREALGVTAPVEPAAEQDPDGGDLQAILTEMREESALTGEPAGGGRPNESFAAMLSQFKDRISEARPSEDAGDHYDLGLAFKEMGLIDEAIAEFQTALRGSDERLKVYEELGHCFIMKGQYNVSLKVLKRALRAPRPDEASLLGVYYHMGQCFEALGDREQARVAYEKVLDINPHFGDVPSRVGRL
jgi:tetratricopeptide (TPR) repeat protein